MTAREAQFEKEWRTRFDRFAARGGSLASVSGWSERGLAGRLRALLASVDEARIAPGTLFLDVGCGTGIYCASLAERGFRALGADYSTGMLGRARDVVGEDEGIVGLAAADATRLPFADESMGAVVNIGVLQHLDDLEAVLSEFHRVLKPGGQVFIATLNRISLQNIAGAAYRTLRAWRSGRLVAPKHVVRRSTGYVRRAARSVGLETTALKGLHILPGPLRIFEGPLTALDRIRPFGKLRSLVMPAANAYMIVLKKA